MGVWLWSRSVASVCSKSAFRWCSGLGCASLETKRPSVCRANVRTKGRGGVFRCRRKPYAAASSRPTSQPQVAILRLHDTKRSLADALLEGADMSSRLSKEELLKLLSDQG